MMMTHPVAVLVEEGKLLLDVAQRALAAPHRVGDALRVAELHQDDGAAVGRHGQEARLCMRWERRGKERGGCV